MTAQDYINSIQAVTPQVVNELANLIMDEIDE